jgi:DNA-binding helix-hairpin-helix protein with protein kinase domain
LKILRASNQQLLSLGSATTLGMGGEARIFAPLGTPGLAAKVYHRPTPDRSAKLSAMLANPPMEPILRPGHVSIAWPSELLLAPDGSGTVLGFLMPRVQGMTPIIDFYHPKTRRTRHPLFHYQYLLRTARNLAACVAALHARGYVIGDLNESNILVGETALMTLVDTDSFQVPVPGGKALFRCRVGKPEFTPPELQSVQFAWVDRKPEHDLFGLAVVIYQILMEGIHPFGGRFLGRGEPPSLEARIAAGWFPCAPGLDCPLRPMPTAPSFEILHPQVRELFARCFVEGFRDPARRPDAQTWQAALMGAEDSLATCKVNEQHRFGNHLAACPWCERRERFGGLDSFPSAEEVRRARHLAPLFKWLGPGEPVVLQPQVVDYDTAVAMARADARRRQLVRRWVPPGLGALVLALALYWVWAIRLWLAH